METYHMNRLASHYVTRLVSIENQTIEAKKVATEINNLACSQEDKIEIINEMKRIAMLLDLPPNIWDNIDRTDNSGILEVIGRLIE